MLLLTIQCTCDYIYKHVHACLHVHLYIYRSTYMYMYIKHHLTSMHCTYSVWHSTCTVVNGLVVFGGQLPVCVASLYLYDCSCCSFLTVDSEVYIATDAWVVT